MRLEENPFDRNPQSVPLIRFMLHSSSLSREMLTENSPAHRLVKLNSFKEVVVMSLPIEDKDTRNTLIANGIALTEYETHGTFVGLRASDGSIHNVISPFTKELPKNLWKPIFPDSEVVLADLFASNVCDYLVVGVNEPSLKARVARDSIITAEQALELVRILLTAHGRFYIGSGLPIGEMFYYLYRYKSLFKESQYAWTVAAHAQGKGLSEKVKDNLESLGTRLEFICRAYDKVAFFSLKTANYDDQRKQLYHLAYFVMLVTGLFDNLAHIIKEFYSITVKGRMDLDLRVPTGGKPKKFYQALQSQNVALYEFLTEPEVQRDIKAFYPLRHPFVHREFPTGVQLSQSSEPVENVFQINSETFEELRKLSDSFTFITGGRYCFLYPLPFIKWALGISVELVNRVLSYIEWDSACLTLPKDVQDKIRTSDEIFKQSLSQFLSLPEEPLYF